MFSLWLSAAFAADNEINVEVGTLTNTDNSFSWFADDNGMASFGLKGGVAVHDRVAILGGWQHAGRGATVYTDGSTSQFDTALRTEVFSLGGKVDAPVTDWFLPYIAANALLVRGGLTIDEDGDTQGGADIRKGSVAPGVAALGGVEFRIPQGSAAFTLAATTEVGYAYVAPMSFDGLGSVQPGGLIVRGGVGVRF